MDWNEKAPQLEQELTTIVRNVAHWIKSQKEALHKDQVQRKGHNDLVSYVDLEAENKLVKALTEIFPAGFITEEEATENRDSEYIWVIDPLDGTTNFVHGLPFYSVSVALKHKEKYVLAAVAEPNLDEVFSAYKGGGARLNGVSIKVSDVDVLADSLLATGFPYQDFGRLGSYLELLYALINKTRGIRRFGSAALDLVYTAMGRFDGFYEYGLNEWDVAAGALIVEEAGGKVSCWKDTDEYVKTKTIVATNSILHPDIVKSIRKVFG